MQNETEIVLANLDWLMLHEGMKLDYASRTVTMESQPPVAGMRDPYYTLDDLAVEGLTPATVAWMGRAALAICTEAVTSLQDAERIR